MKNLLGSFECLVHFLFSINVKSHNSSKYVVFRVLCELRAIMFSLKEYEWEFRKETWSVVQGLYGQPQGIQILLATEFNHAN